MAYEAGFKLSLLGRKVQLAGAAFYYDYQDKQLGWRWAPHLKAGLPVARSMRTSISCASRSRTGCCMTFTFRPDRPPDLHAASLIGSVAIGTVSLLNACAMSIDRHCMDRYRERLTGNAVR